MTEFEEIYDRFQPEVYRFLLGLACYDRSAAEELTQETFYQAFLSFGRFRGECSMRTWLFQIAKNIYAKYVRREARQRDLAARRSDEAVPPPTAELERQEMLERLRTLLDELDEPARSVMQYRLYSEASYAEIACALHIRANTAAVIYNRTVARLRAAMKERYGYEI